MEQQKFIFLSNNVQADHVTQDEDGNTIVGLREGVKVAHNYKHNEMKITFEENDTSFLIPSREELEAVYRIHLENVNLQPLYNYCEKFDKV